MGEFKHMFEEFLPHDSPDDEMQQFYEPAVFILFNRVVSSSFSTDHGEPNAWMTNKDVILQANDKGCT